VKVKEKRNLRNKIEWSDFYVKRIKICPWDVNPFTFLKS
jgi:hypothetical protein